MSQAAIADWPMRVAAPAPVPVSSPHAINLRGVSKSFGATTVLQGIDLTVDTGEFLAIVGRSGCGKTTLLRLLAGIEQPSAGLIDTGAAGVARMMFQDARLLPWRTVLDNVAIGRHGPGWQDEALAALALVGLEDKAAVWPATLSGGQRQRVALARALISRPRLLLLDEPLSALDALTRLEMQALIDRIRAEQGFTAVLVTHDVAEAVNLADRVIVLEEGRIAETWHIPEPHPRTRSSRESAEIEARILARLLDRK